MDLTEPILELGEYTNRYQGAKSVNEKTEIEKEMKENEKLFGKIIDNVKNEKLEDNFLETKNEMKRRFTINPNSKKKKLSTSEKKKSVLFVG